MENNKNLFFMRRVRYALILLSLTINKERLEELLVELVEIKTQR